MKTHSPGKKILSLLLALVMCVGMLPVSAFAEEPAKGEGEPEPHVHEYGSYVTEPTCTEQGYTTLVCSCGDSYIDPDSYVPALGHTPKDVAEVPATCSSTGTGAGQVCAVCSATLGGFEELPMLAHTPMSVEEVPATCSKPGTAAGTVCSVCGAVIDGCGELPVTAHTPKDVAEVPSTCTKPGTAAGEVCAVCGAVLSGCEELPLAEHAAEDVEAVASTCVKAGHTAGVVCSVCGETLEGCEDLPLAEHSWKEVEEIPAEVGKPGRTAGVACSVCGEVQSGCEEIPALKEKPVITVEKEPEDAEPVEGAVEFAVAASVNTEDELAYRWQRLDESVEYVSEEAREVAWEDIKDENTATLRVEKLDDEKALEEAAKYAYRCVLTADEAEAVTKEARILKAKLRDGAKNIPTSGECGDNVTWVLSNDGVLTISGTGAMADYTVTGSPWYRYTDNISSVIIENGVTSIGNAVFGYCSNMTSVTIPSSVNSIGERVFYKCGGLTSITIPSDVMSIGDDAFYDCIGLTSVTIPSGVTNIGSCAFYGCSGLTSVMMPDSVTSIGSAAFNECSSLTEVNYGGTHVQWNDIAIANNNEALLAAVRFAGIAVNESNFPDGAFRTYVQNLDTGGDGYLSEEEIATATVIDVEELSIASLEGISYFTSLEELNCRNNSLTALDVSGLPSLRTLDCSYNQIATLNPGSDSPLITLRCNDNEITSIDLSNCQYMTQLWCWNNAITQLDIGPAQELVNAFAYGVMEPFYAGISYFCGHADLSMDTNTEIINPYRISYSANGGEGAPAPDIKFRGEDLSLTTVEPTRAGYSFLGWGLSADATEPTYSSGATYSADGNAILYAVWAPVSYSIDADRFPDEAFRGYVSSYLDVDGDGSLAGDEIDSVTALNVEGQGIGSLEGVDLFTNLTILNCRSNSLTALDVSGLPSLQTLDCSYNQITTLTLGSNSPLEILRCNDNEITSIDLSNCPDVMQLWCWGNAITQLNIWPAPEMTRAYAFGVTEFINGGVSYFSGSADLSVDTTVEIISPCYQVSYSANGGEGAPAYQIKTAGVPLELTWDVPYFEGNSFLGWATSATATTPEYQPGHSYTIDANVTLYAVWSVKTYTVSYDANEGEGAPEAQGKTHGIDLPLSDVVPVRLAYDFLGWATTADATAAQYQPGSMYTADEDATLYAVWKPVTYTASFDANGGTGTVRAVSFTVEAGEVSLPNAFKLTYCSFKDWNTAADGSGTAVGATETAQNLVALADENHAIKLYAQWNYLHYSIAFDPNGGEGEMEPLPMSYSVPAALPASAFTRTGYNFASWNTRANGGGTNYAVGASVKNLSTTEGAVVTLYAKWTAKTYTVHFDANADDATGTMADQILTYDKAAALRANAFKRTGWFFAGWSADPDAEEPEYANSQSVTNLASEGEYTLYAIWKDARATAVRLTNESDESVNGTTISHDMARTDTFQLRSACEPDNASQLVTWKTSSAAIATVDADGLVVFHRPGAVTITAAATDGSGKSAWVKFSVYYVTPATSFTASLSAESFTYGMPTSFGLQVGDTAAVNVYGTDKSTPLNSRIFEYSITTAGGDAFLGLNENEPNDNYVTALAPNKTVTVRATLIGDPLKRGVNLSVKTVPVQTAAVTFGQDKPYYDSEYAFIWYVTTNGSVPANSYSGDGTDIVSISVYLSKSAQAKTLDIMPQKHLPPDGDTTAVTRGSFTYASNNTAVASVSANPDGSVHVTVKANASGACTVTATSADLAKAQGSFSVYVTDFTPRMSVTSVTLDSYADDGYATLSLTPSYDSTVKAVEFLDGGYDRASKHYTTNVNGITAELIDTDGSNATVRLNAGRSLPNTTIKGQLRVVTRDPVFEENEHEFWLDLNVVSKSTLPTVSFTQPQKFDIFFTDSQAWLNFSWNQRNLTNVELVAEDFVGEFNTEQRYMMLYFSENYLSDVASGYVRAPSTKGTLKFYFDGLTYPVEKPITIATVKTRPPWKLSAASGIFNSGVGDLSARLHLVNNSSSNWWWGFNDDDRVWLNGTSIVQAQIHTDGNDIVLDLEPGSKSGRLNIAVWLRNWAEPVVFPYTVTVNTTKPTLRAENTTLTINSLWENRGAYTNVLSNLANLDLSGIGGMEMTTASAAAQGKLRVQFGGSYISAWIEDGETVPNGTYSFSCTPEGYNKITVSVRVISTLPTAKLNNPRFTGLPGFNQYEEINLTNYVALSDLGFKVSRIEVTPASASDAVTRDALESGAIRIEKSEEDVGYGYAMLDVVIDHALNRAYTYNFKITPYVKDGNGVEHKLAAMSFSLQTIDDRYKIPANFPFPKTFSLNNRCKAVDEQIITEGLWGMESFDMIVEGTSAAARELLADGRLSFEQPQLDDPNTDSARLTLRVEMHQDESEGKVVKAGSYGFTVTPIVNGGKYKPFTCTVQVVGTVPKVTLSASSVRYNQANGVPATTTVLTDPAYYVSGFAEMDDEGQLEQDGVVLYYDQGTALLFAAAEEDVPLNKSVRFTLTPIVVSRLTDEETPGTPITLTVTNTNVAKYSVTVGMSGKLDSVLRFTDAGMLTCTVTGNSGLQSCPTYAELVDANGDWVEGFEVSGVTLNAKGQPYVVISLAEDAVFTNNQSFTGLRLKFSYSSVYDDVGAIEALSQALTLRVTQSAGSLTSPNASQTVFQSQSQDREVVYDVYLKTPAGATISDADQIRIGDIRLWQNALADEVGDSIRFEIVEDIYDTQPHFQVYVRIKDMSKLVAGKNYTLPLEVTLDGANTGATPLKLNLTVAVKP